MTHRIRRLAIALPAAVLAGAAVVLLRQTPVFGGWRAVILVAVLMLLAPVARNASRRIMLVGALVVGWLPVLWWVDLWGFRDRVTWVLAASVAGLVLWFLSGPLRSRLRSLMPRFHATDAIPATVAAGSVWLFWPLLVAASDARALTLLMKSGWDHVAHYFMAAHVAAVGSLPAVHERSPDGSDVLQGHYPKQFHILVDGVNELFSGPLDGLTLQQYGRGTVLVLILVIVVLAAALAQLPGFVRRPLIAWPMIVLAVGAVAIGPGTVALAAGFPNFVVACLLPVVAAAVAVGAARVPQPLTIAVLGGLVLATAHTWLLLAPLTAVAALAILLPWRRARWRGPRAAWIVSAGLLIAALAGAGYAAVIAASQLSDATLTTGGAEAFPVGTTAMVLLAVLAAGVLCLGRAVRYRTSAVRVGAAGSIALVMVVLLAVVGGRQLLLSGEFTYYFGKLASAAGIAGFGVLAVVVSGIRFGAPRVRRRAERVSKVAASVLATLAATQAFGYVGPTFGDAITEKAPGLQYRSDAFILTSGESPEALRLLAAADLSSDQPFGTTVYLAPLYGDPLMRLANQWHLALSGRWSVDAEALGRLVDTGEMADAVADDDLAHAIADVLEAEPGVTIIVAPEIHDELVAALPPALRDRVITWPSG